MSNTSTMIAVAALCLPPPPRMAPPELNPTAAQDYLRRANALYLVGIGVSVTDAARRARMDRQTLLHLIDRALQPAPSGGCRGYRACLPPQRKRRCPVHRTPFTTGLPLPPLPAMSLDEGRRWRRMLLDLVQAGYLEVRWPSGPMSSSREVPHA